MKRNSATRRPSPRVSQRSVEHRPGELQSETLEARLLLSARPIVADRLDWSDEYAAQEVFARDFLTTYAGTETLQTGHSQLELQQIRYGLASTHTRFQQTWDGLPVYRSFVSVHQGPDGGVQIVHDQAFDGLRIEHPVDIPIVSFDQAEQIGREAADVRVPWMETTGELVWFADATGSARMAWQMTITSIEPLGQFLTIVDATTGKLILQQDELQYDSGSGMTYDPNPYQTQGNGTGMTDNNDANNTELTNQRINVTLQGLDSGTGLLKGEFVDLSTLNSTTVTDVDADEASRIYNYTRDDERFEQVVVYYAIDGMARYFHTLGFDDDNPTPNGIRDFTTLANAHWYTADNSFYSTANDAVHFGDGGVDDAEDADVVAHEYGHAVQHDQNSAWGGGEMGAMGEGFGDYLAASYYADNGDATFQSLHAAAVAEWDATSYSSTNPPALRRVDGTKMYPDDLTGEVHDDGEIWSAALWDIRTALGGTTADQIILESHFGLAAGATMPMGAEAVLLADQNLNGGANQTAIRQAFIDRGILEPPQTLGTVDLDKNFYNIGDLINVTVVDANAIEPIQVTLTTTAGDSETVALTYDGVSAYLGSLASGAGAISVGDGTLQVILGDTITATYNDPDDGSGTPAVATDTAVVSNIHEYPSTNVPVGITDNTTVTSTITITDVALILDVDVMVNITHTWDSDLDVFLIAPDGTRVELFTDVGGSGDNFNDTMLDDEAATAISSGTAPFAGSYRPEGLLAALDGGLVTGVWTLEISDDAGGDIGSLNAWSLFIDLQSADAGTIELDQPSYQVGDPVTISVFDTNATLPVTVTVETNAGDLETITLADMGGGQFQSTVSTVAGSAVVGDGLIQGTPGKVITATYFDADDGTGTPQTVQDTANFTNIIEYPSANVPVGISDNTTVTSTITITDAGLVADVDVQLNITHTWDSDLDVFLIAPDGTRIELFSDVGGSGNNFNNTILDDEASASIATGAAPFAGRYKPMGLLATVDGMSITGVWTLEISDDAGGDIGSLNAWSLFIDVIPVEVIAPTTFDFGTDTSPVASGHAGTGLEAYAAGAGFGWEPGAIGLQEVDRELGTTLTRDLVLVQAGTFLIDVPDGTYDVTVQLGDSRNARDNMQVSLEGIVMGVVSNPAGTITSHTYRVAVNDGQISLNLADLGGANTLAGIAGLSYRFGDEFHIDFGPAGSSVLAGFVAGTTADHDATNSFGWLPGAVNLSDQSVSGGTLFTRDSVLVTDGTLEIEVANGTYDVSVALGDLANDRDLVNLYLEGTLVDTVSTLAGAVSAKRHTVTVGDGLLTVRLEDTGGVNNLASIVGIDVLPPPATPAAARFDFGPTSSEVSTGYIGVRNANYSAGTGYGWTFPLFSKSSALSNGFGTALTRDGVRAKDGTFKVDLPNGTYDVSFSLGDVTRAVTGVQVYAEGNLLGTYSASRGQIRTETVRVRVNDGQLSLRFYASSPLSKYFYVTGLVVAEANEWHFDMGTAGSPVQAGFQQATGAAWSASGSFGWLPGALGLGTVDRGTGTSFTRDFVTTEDGTFVTDLADGTYEVTVSMGDVSGFQDPMDIHLEGAYVGTMSTSVGQTTSASFVVTVSDGQLNVRIAQPGLGFATGALLGLDIEPVVMIGPKLGGADAPAAASNSAAALPASPGLPSTAAPESAEALPSDPFKLAGLWETDQAIVFDPSVRVETTPARSTGRAAAGSPGDDWAIRIARR